eukprot:scaffold59617_cov79-Phaeocystis_antarctica.AAC.10
MLGLSRHRVEPVTLVVGNCGGQGTAKDFARLDDDELCCRPYMEKVRDRCGALTHQKFGQDLALLIADAEAVRLAVTAHTHDAALVGDQLLAELALQHPLWC